MTDKFICNITNKDTGSSTSREFADKSIALDWLMLELFKRLGSGDMENGGEGSLWRCAKHIYDTLNDGGIYEYANLEFRVLKTGDVDNESLHGGGLHNTLMELSYKYEESGADKNWNSILEFLDAEGLDRQFYLNIDTNELIHEIAHTGLGTTPKHYSTILSGVVECRDFCYRTKDMIESQYRYIRKYTLMGY